MTISIVGLGRVAFRFRFFLSKDGGLPIFQQWWHRWQQRTMYVARGFFQFGETTFFFISKKFGINKLPYKSVIRQRS